MADQQSRSPIPNGASGEARERLLQALRAANIADHEAREQARLARLAKGRARLRTIQYENLVAEYNGQLTIYDALEGSGHADEHGIS